MIRCRAAYLASLVTCVLFVAIAAPLLSGEPSKIGGRFGGHSRNASDLETIALVVGSFFLMLMFGLKSAMTCAKDYWSVRGCSLSRKYCFDLDSSAPFTLRGIRGTGLAFLDVSAVAGRAVNAGKEKKLRLTVSLVCEGRSQMRRNVTLGVAEDAKPCEFVVARRGDWEALLTVSSPVSVRQSDECNVIITAFSGARRPVSLPE